MYLLTDSVKRSVHCRCILRPLLLATVTILLTISCSTVAFTGRHRVLMFPDSQITALSDEAYSALMDTMRLSANQIQTSMVVSVGQRLTSALEKYLASTGQSDVVSGLKWDYKLVRSAQANAFCMPNGKIVFYEGIMPYCTTPDDIAVVMGHEIAHAIARHGNERMSQQRLLGTAGSIASVVIGARTNDQTRSLFDTAFNLGSQYGVLLPFSRKHELEADRIGLIIMAIAGYDVDRAPVFWRNMAAGSRTSVPTVLSTHPSDANRLREIEKNIPAAKSVAASLR